MSTTPQQPYITLNNGEKMPQVGLGTWKGLDQECEDFVYNAIVKGYRHIDTAKIYKNEEEVGRGIKRAIDEGIVKREELFVVTKLWNDCHRIVEESMRESLAKLGLDYVDLYLVHWPVAWKSGTNLVDEEVNIDDTWRAMEKLVALGLTKSIGVSNYSIAELEHLLSFAQIKPVTNQVEIHPYFNNYKLQKFCLAHGIVLTAYSALFPRSDNYKFTPWRDMAADPTILEIAKAHNKSPQQICLRWNVQAGNIVITKSSKPERLQQNFEITQFELTPEEMAKMDAFEPIRYRNPHDFLLPKEEWFFKDE